MAKDAAGGSPAAAWSRPPSPAGPGRPWRRPA